MQRANSVSVECALSTCPFARFIICHKYFGLGKMLK